jgi:hypothetical protein
MVQPSQEVRIVGSDRFYCERAYLSDQSAKAALIGQNTLERTHFPQFCGGMWVLAFTLINEKARSQRNNRT